MHLRNANKLSVLWEIKHPPLRRMASLAYEGREVEPVHFLSFPSISLFKLYCFKVFSAVCHGKGLRKKLSMHKHHALLAKDFFTSVILALGLCLMHCQFGLPSARSIQIYGIHGR